MYEDVVVERQGSVGWVRINRPERRNALRPETLKEICRGVDELEGDEAIRAIVLTGEGKHFAAGAEFSFLEGLKSTPAPEIKAQIYSHFQGAARRLYNSRKPTVAAVNGAAVTVGCELALACDFRIVTPTATFQESWIKLGLIPPLGGLFLLPRIVGMGRAAEICLMGRAIGAEQALAWGLASEVVEVDTLQARASELAVELAALPPLAYAAAKEGLHRGLESSMENEWTANVSAQSILLGTQDFVEGLASVTQKRAPSFRGA